MSFFQRIGRLYLSRDVYCVAGDCGRLSLSFRPKPSIGAVRLSFLVARFGFNAPVIDPELALSPALVLRVLDVPLDVENPKLDGDTGECDV